VRFASNSKAFWSLPGTQLSLSPEAIDCYLHHFTVTIEHSIFEEVTRLLPAHYRVFTPDGSRAVRYWTPDFHHKIRIGEAEALERIEASLKEAVRKRLAADEPRGVFLSGGVDSSMVVALASQLSGPPVKTFSLGFEPPDDSELEYAGAVASRYATAHHEIRLAPDALDVLPSLVWEYGEPFADSSTIPAYYASKAAREQVGVAFTGDGADSLVGGHGLVRASFYAVHYDRLLPSVLRRPLETWLFAAERTGYARKLKTLATHAHHDPARRHGYAMAFNQHQREALYTDSFRASLGSHRPWHIYERHHDEVASLSILDRNLYYGLVVRLPSNYLVKLDVAAMKVALELGSPYLDPDLCAICASLEPGLKVRGGRPKYLLKKLAERYLPRRVIYRPDRGFSLPLERWLRDDFGPTLQALLPDGNLVRAGWVRKQEVQRLIDEHTGGAALHAHRLWSLLWLELWHRIFVERSMTGRESLRA
jgi:asparagine synthase (glutamine-hydrolysing)